MQCSGDGIDRSASYMIMNHERKRLTQSNAKQNKKDATPRLDFERQGLCAALRYGGGGRRENKRDNRWRMMVMSIPLGVGEHYVDILYRLSHSLEYMVQGDAST